MDYNSILKLANKHHFPSFTELQKCAFTSLETYDYNKDLFIIGETSSGKTLIPLLLYSGAVQDAAVKGESCPKMLFVVPYRALAAQKVKEISAFFKDQNLKIIQSTGEFRKDDDAVQKGQVHIAVIITEKVYKYEARNSSFLSMYDYLVLDEIGLVNNADRGVRLDFIFAWANNQKVLTGHPRTIALGTPFYDWSAYISSYGFHSIQISNRPVELTEVSVKYTASEIQDVDGDSNFLHPMCMITTKDIYNLRKRYEDPMVYCQTVNRRCPIKEPARNDATRCCPVTKSSCAMPIEYVPDGCSKGTQFLLLKICREHLIAGHQILVFVNDRERVKQYCGLLYRQLRDLLPEAPSPEECRKEILSYCGLEGEDMFGILEYENDSTMALEFYQAFKCGIGFHSAALPNELRAYVEEKFLDSREMKIVCSTETLAFGVNSSVDVVIVADLCKHENSDVRLLTLNEYQNYAGRAGRLRRNLGVETAKGYVYTLVKTKEKNEWKAMLDKAATPERLYSRFHSDKGQKMSFFLMNLLPTNGEGSIPVEQLVRMVSTLPQDGSHTSEILTPKVQKALQFLIRNELAVKVTVRSRGRQDVYQEARYCLTPLGNRLRGYILDSEDYKKLLSALKEYIDGIFLDSDRITFLYRLLQTKQAKSGLNSIFTSSETRWNLNDLRNYIMLRARNLSHPLDWLNECRDERILSILAAILAWSEGESAKTLYRQFGIHYALLSKVTEQIAYLIEIAAEVLPSRMEQIWYEKQNVYQDLMKISDENFSEQVDVKVEELHNLFVSIYFGVNTDIATDLLDYLDSLCMDAPDKDPAALALARELSLKYINPKSARMHRRIAIRYLFFKNPPVVDWTNISARNNFFNQRWQYKKDIAAMDPHIVNFFRAVFGSKYTDEKMEVSV